MQRTLRHPGFWTAVGFCVLVIVVQSCAAGVLAVVQMIVSDRRGALEIVSDPLALGFINLLAVGSVVALGLLLNKLTPRQSFPLGSVSLGAWLAVPIIGVGAAIVLSEVDNAFRYFIPPSDWFVRTMGEMMTKEGRTLSIFFALVVVAPLTEELLCRGIILRGFLARFRPGAAISLSAFLFAALHMNPWQAISAFTLGWIFAWYYLRTGSIWPCVAGHAVNNGIVAVIMTSPFGLWDAPTVQDLMRVEFQPLWLDTVGVALLVAGIWLFRKCTPNAPPNLLPPVLRPESIPPVLNA